MTLTAPIAGRYRYRVTGTTGLPAEFEALVGDDNLLVLPEYQGESTEHDIVRDGELLGTLTLKFAGVHDEVWS